MLRGPWHVTTRPNTYSQNSMTGEVKFSEWVTALAPERFRKSTQCSVGDKVACMSVRDMMRRDVPTSYSPPQP